MATRRFCDYCDTPLSPENAVALVREIEVALHDPTEKQDWPEGEPRPKPEFVMLHGRLVIYNEHEHEVQDICEGCQLHIINDGLPRVTAPPSKIAFMQPSVAADREGPPLYAEGKLPDRPPIPILPAKPPIPHIAPAEEAVFVRSESPASAGDASQNQEAK